MEQKLKICGVLREAEMEADFVQVLEGLARNEHEVFTLLHHPTTTWKPQIPSLRVVVAGERTRVERASIVNSLSLKVVQTIRKEKIDVVYATGTRLGEGLLGGLLTGTPVLCDIRNPWSIQWRDLGAQHVRFRTLLGHYLRSLRYVAEEKLVHRAAHIVAFSSGIKRWLIDYLALPPDKITVISPHVNTSMFAPGADPTRVRTQFGLEGAFVLMYVGAIDHCRGIDLLIDALHAVRSTGRDVRLLVVGPHGKGVQPYIEGLYQQITALGLEKAVTLTKYVPFHEVPEYLAAADVCVIPHRHNFTYEISPPVKVVEYMASQKPIVTTDVGIRDFVTQRATGLIVAPENAQAMAAAFIELYDNPAFTQEIARNGRNFVVNNLRQELMISKYENVLAAIAPQQMPNHSVMVQEKGIL